MVIDALYPPLSVDHLRNRRSVQTLSFLQDQSHIKVLIEYIKSIESHFCRYCLQTTLSIDD